jgi:hypothetical protein
MLEVLGKHWIPVAKRDCQKVLTTYFSKGLLSIAINRLRQKKSFH